MERERDVEKYLSRRVRLVGGMDFKWVSPGNVGVPDRIIVLPGGRVWLVELKTKDGVLSKVQEWQCDRLRDLDCRVAVLYGMDDVDAWMAEREREASG